jgi:LPXTG-motif cell wall-anchored protein
VAVVTPRLPFAILAVLAALVLVLPSTGALAQSVGDNQYQDPLGGSNGSGQKSSSASRSGGGSGGRSSSAGGGGSSLGGGPAASSPAASAGNSRAVPLARTGFDALIPAIAGVLLLLGGGVLLFRTRPPSGA